MLTTPRWTVRFSNGFWKAFDTSRYTTQEIYLTYVDALKAVARANSFKVSHELR